MFEMLFESPWILISVGVAFFCAIAIFRNARPEKARWWQLLLPVIVITAAFAVDHFVQTDMEKINSRITSARDAVIARNTQVIVNMIDSNYSDPRHLDKQMLGNKCRQYLGRPFADRIKINSNVVTINGDTAAAVINATVHLNSASEFAQYANLAVVTSKIDFVRRGKDWLVSSVEIQKVNNSEPPSW